MRNRIRKQKSGAVLICVIVCMAVATLLLAGMLRQTLSARRQIRTERQSRQTDWLVQAGAERAAFQLANDPEYTGEVWSLSADRMGGSDPAAVTISVAKADSKDSSRASIKIVAQYPSDRVTSIRRTHEFLIDLPQLNEPGE